MAKRLKWILGLMILAAFFCVGAAAETGGPCGNGLTWTLSDDSVLTISGNGNMDNYDIWAETYAPWASYQSDIEVVVLESGVTSIGDGAFNNCENMTSITIPEGITRIGEFALNGCRNLTSIFLPSGINEIGVAAFQFCWQIDTFIIPEGVSYLPNGVFQQCQGMTDVFIPASVENIYESAFYNCFNLKDVYYAGSEDQWNDITIESGDNGYLINAQKHFNASISDIGNDTGSEDNNITWNLNNNGVLTISGTGDMPDYNQGEAPWYNDRSLITKVIIEDGVTGIGQCSFDSCSNLSEVSIPDTVTGIGDMAFFECSGLTDVIIPDSVTRIGFDAFQSTGLTSVTIPASVTSMGYDVFNGCTNLIRIDVDIDNPNYYSADGVLFNKNMTTLDTYPAGKTGYYTIPDGVTHISDYAFADCSGLTAITIPRSVTVIDYCAFASCSNLLDVWYYGSSSQWDQIDFVEGNGRLTGADIHFDITVSGTCGINLMYGIDSNKILIISGTGPMDDYPRNAGQPPWRWNSGDITGIVIGKNVTSIGTRAFWFITSPTEIEIPANITSIGDEVFSGCSSLTDILVNSGNVNYASMNGVLFSKDKTELIAYPNGKAGNYTVPGSVTAIRTGAFEFNGNLTGITIPVNVTSIEDLAFSGCNNLSSVAYGGDEDQWNAISIGDGNECLTDADFLFNAETEPGEITFKLKDGVLTISGTGPMENYESEEPAPWYKDRASIKKVIIKEGVTRIGEYAFYEYNKLTDVTMADSVRTIGSSAFRDCKALKTIQLSNGLTAVDSFAFEGCSRLSSITLPGSLQTIGTAAFASCSISTVGITSGSGTAWDFFYTLENQIGYHDYLYHITLPSGVKDVGEGAFCNNPLPYDAPDFILPAGLITVESEAFQEINARYVWISDSVKSIGAGAFAGCTNLEYIYIPVSCSIEDNAIPAGAKILVINPYTIDPCPAEIYAEINGNGVVEYENPYGGNG